MASDYTYAVLKTKIDEIAARMATNLTRVATGRTQVDSAVADLAQMGAAYTQTLAEIDAGLAANPANIAWQAISAEKNLLVAEFIAQKNDVDVLKAKMDVK